MIMPRFLAAALFLLLLPLLIFARDLNLDALGDEAVESLSRYLQIDTGNPPGNELAGAEYLKSLLEKEGIAATLYEAVPGRANLYALLRGEDPSQGSLILLNHIDVVPADPRYWKHPPFSGTRADGMIWGRGALDMKGMGMVELYALIALKRSGIRLKRDVIYLAVADEEMGGKYGTPWMLEKHPELFQNVAGIINEEGPGHLEEGKLKFWEIRPGQKSLVWLKLIARGQPGHGSMPFRDTAPNRLVRALYKIMNYVTPIRILPETREFFARLAEHETGKRAWQLRNLEKALKDPDFYRWFTGNRMYNALSRDTISITQFEGSNKTNVIPPEASAAIDCRLLPGEDPKAFIEKITKLINDPNIEIKPLQLENPVPASPTNTELFRTISSVIQKYYPDALIVTPYSRGANDSRFFQQRGILSYGFFPFVVTREESETMHGNDERISEANIRTGVKMLVDVVVRFAGK